jgi:hypothetical protein
MSRDDDPLADLARLEGVPSAYAAARDGVDVLLRDRGLRRTSPEQTAESLLRGAWASAVLEGSGSSLDEVRSEGGDATARATVRVATEMLALVPTLGRSPLQTFARLHALAGSGSVSDDALGRPRSAESSRRLQRLSARLLADTSAPAMLVAAVVHGELATTAPFASHNGIVARAAERLVLVARGVDPASLLVPEEGHRRLRAEYESNLRAYADAGGSSGVHAWLLYCAEAYTLGAEASPVR